MNKVTYETIKRFADKKTSPFAASPSKRRSGSSRCSRDRPAGIEPKGPRIATEYDCQPTRARGVLRYIAQGLWDRPPKAMLADNLGPRLWRFNHMTGRYVITDRRTRSEA